MTLLALLADGAGGMVTYGEFAAAFGSAVALFGGAITILWNIVKASLERCNKDRESDQAARAAEQKAYADRIDKLHEQMAIDREEDQASRAAEQKAYAEKIDLLHREMSSMGRGMFTELIKRSEAEDSIRVSMTEAVAETRKATERSNEIMQSLIDGIVRDSRETMTAIKEISARIGSGAEIRGQSKSR